MSKEYALITRAKKGTSYYKYCTMMHRGLSWKKEDSKSSFALYIKALLTNDRQTKMSKDDHYTRNRKGQSLGEILISLIMILKTITYQIEIVSNLWLKKEVAILRALETQCISECCPT